MHKITLTKYVIVILQRVMFQFFVWLRKRCRVPFLRGIIFMYVLYVDRTHAHCVIHLYVF